MKQIIRIVLLVLLALVLLLAAALGIFSYRNLHWYDKNQRSIKRAGAIERQVTLPSGSVINYGEVPSDKPALLLIHGQMGAWEDYADLLPELFEDGTKHFLLAHLSRENNTPDIARQTAVCGMQMAGVENAEDYILQVAPIENLTGGAITF